MQDLQDIINLRHTLHRYPELSNQEFETSKRISEFIGELNPDEEISIDPTGKIFVFDSGEPGETLVFRCELDALPIKEKSVIAYRSAFDGVGHLCGHDGHMAILCRLAQRLSEARPKRGKVALLFQQAEESYLGAKAVVESPKFHALHPDYIFALHNIPGKPANTVLVKEGSFSAASCGITIRLEGRTSHAAEPENGLNPYFAADAIIRKVLELPKNEEGKFHSRIFTTLIYNRLGEISFGVSPGSLEMGITLRAYENADLDTLCRTVEHIIEEEASEAGLEHHFEYCEIYPATTNDHECVEMIEQSAQTNGLKLEQMENPNHWSEDFAYFTATNKGAQFGFGAGEEVPVLHNPSYDFPDEIIDPASKMFFEIYESKLR